MDVKCYWFSYSLEKMCKMLLTLTGWIIHNFGLIVAKYLVV